MKINSLRLTKRLTGNADLCVEILEDIGYEDIKYNQAKQELRFARIGGKNPSSVCLFLDTLKWICFSTAQRGDIYTLIMSRKGLTFPEALKYTARLCGFEEEDLKSNIDYPFKGFYKRLAKSEDEPETELATYDDEIINEFCRNPNMMFLRDGIDFSTQERFNIGYDIESQRVTVPEYTLTGQLCGIMGRLNKKDCPYDKRWLPIIPCSRSLTLYGYHINYADIQLKDKVIIGESEKFVQQLYSIGNHTGLALCGCNVSGTQAKYIKGLMTDKIILALDEGLTEAHIREQAEKLKVENILFQNKVGYIYDKENIYLPKNSKASPSDLGGKLFKKLCEECVIWL